MFENLKAGDTIKIGEKEFKINYYYNATASIKNSKGEIDCFTISELEFIGAEIVRKAPPKYTPIRCKIMSGYYYCQSAGKFNQMGWLVCIESTGFESAFCEWEVLEIEK
jgi:hypothetical protein